MYRSTSFYALVSGMSGALIEMRAFFSFLSGTLGLKEHLKFLKKPHTVAVERLKAGNPGKNIEYHSHLFPVGKESSEYL